MMGKIILQVEISDTLNDRLYRIVPDPVFLFRNKDEPGHRAVERAVEFALTQFLDNLENRAKARASKATGAKG